METERIKFLRNELWIYTNIGAQQALEIDQVSNIFIHLTSHSKICNYSVLNPELSKKSGKDL